MSRDLNDIICVIDYYRFYTSIYYIIFNYYAHVSSFSYRYMLPIKDCMIFVFSKFPLSEDCKPSFDHVFCAIFIYLFLPLPISMSTRNLFTLEYKYGHHIFKRIVKKLDTNI